MYPMVYFREYPSARLWRTSAITDTLSPLVPYNEGLLYILYCEDVNWNSNDSGSLPLSTFGIGGLPEMSHVSSVSKLGFDSRQNSFAIMSGPALELTSFLSTGYWGTFSKGKWHRSVTPILHIHLFLWLRMSVTLPSFPHTSWSWAQALES
jgi:hypothetical protein